VPSAVERKELQQFPVVKEVRIYCVKLGCLTCVIMWQGCGWSIGLLLFIIRLTHANVWESIGKPCSCMQFIKSRIF